MTFAGDDHFHVGLPDDEGTYCVHPASLPWWARLHRALARLVGGE